MRYMLLLVVLSFFYSCNIKKKQTPRETGITPKHNFAQFINSSIDCNNVEGLKCPVAIIFFKDNQGSFLQIVQYPGVVLENLKGYCELSNYLLLYYGVNDSLSQVYMNIQKIDSNYLVNNYSILDGSDVDIPEKQISFYEILNDTVFRKIVPTEAFLDSFLKQLVDNGLKPPPPPLPEE